MQKYPGLLFSFLLLFFGSGIGMKGISSPLPMGSREAKYPVSAIPEELKKNADMVIRQYDMNIEVKSLTSINIRVHIVKTVFRENALENANLKVNYDQFSKVNSIKAIFYNADGFETNQAKSSEITDESAVPNGLLYTEERVKRVKIIKSIYPFTVEYFYELDLHKMIEYPVWKPQDDYLVSVELSELKLTAEDDLFPRFREVNIPKPAQITKGKGETTISYVFDNLPALEKEKYSIPLEERVPVVYIAPDSYRTLGEDFDFRTWKNIGIWDYSINKDRDLVPDKTRKLVMDLIKDKKDNLSKIKAIYSYVQQTTRYVCVVLGIGGLQTAEASEVAGKGYGDCKGLVNYTKALLSAAGIESYATLVKSGMNQHDILTDFPSDQFDHVILCVPQGNDTVWLECTNQYIPFGFQGSFTDNRHVLVIKPEGGVLVKTPEYPETGNSRDRKMVINVDSAGNAAISITAIYKGLRYEEVDEMETKSVKDLENMFSEKINTPSSTIQKINYKYKKDQNPEAVETVTLSLRSFATITGSRLFLPFTIFGKVSANLNELSTRKTPVYFRHSTIDSDSVEIHIPSGYKVESLPAAVEVSSQFGHYQLTTLQKDNVLIFYRVYESKQGRFPPESFTEYTAYLQKIARADKSNAVLIRK
jgi:transglutaminase-like putative cysteine protease